jgi:hypothetical protein
VTVRTLHLLLLPVALLSLAACHRAPADATSAKLQYRQQTDEARRDLARIPPPSKNLYMSVTDLNAWENPSLTVQEKMISLHVLMPDSNPSDLGKGTMLRPENARRQILNIDPDNLAEALNSIPQEAWPYGRVVAIEEAHEAPAAARVALRRNIEKAVDTLQNIGVVADEWNEGKPVGVR